MAAEERSKLRRYGSLFLRLLHLSVESEVHSFEGTPCWEYTGHREPKGYGRIAVRVPGKKNPQGMAAHRLMAEIVVGRALDPEHETIEHACGITWCINFLHFQLATRADNTAAMRARWAGAPRKAFPPLVDESRFFVDRLVRSLPVPRDQPQPSEAPF